MLRADTADSILSLYDYKLPFSVAEYFCFVFRNITVCNKKLNYKLFSDFIEYKDNIKYVFDKPIKSTNYDYHLIKLTGVEVLIPLNGEDEFMDKYSNFVFSSSDDVGIQWYDDDDYTANNIKPDETKYSGICKITF